MNQLLIFSRLDVVKSDREQFLTLHTFSYVTIRDVSVQCNGITLILPAGGGAYNAHFTFFRGKSPHFALYIIQNNTKLTPLLTFGHYAQNLQL